MARISIITVNYNDKHGIEKTINSVIYQTFKDFEYIIIDGGSNDGSKEIVEMYQSNFAYWVSEKDRGIYHAMNKGINQATGDYLIFMNSNDEFLNENSLKEAVEQFDDSDFILFDINGVEKNTIRMTKIHPQILNFFYMFNSNIAHQSLFIKRNLFEVIGLYDEKYRILADWKFNITALFKFNVSYRVVNSVVANFNLEGISSDAKHRPELDKERDTVIRTEFPQFYQDYIKLNPTYYISAKRSKNPYIRKVQTFFSKIVILLSKY